MSYWISDEPVKFKNISKIRGYSIINNKISFNSENGKLNIEVIMPNSIKVEYSVRKEFIHTPSFAVVNEMKNIDFTVEQTEDVFIINTGEISVRVVAKDGRIIVSDKNGIIVSEDSDSGFCGSKNSVKFRKKMDRSHHFYGLGEKTGFMDKKGRKYVMWNTDDPSHTPAKDPLYTSIPFFIDFDGKTACGIFVDKTCKTCFDIGETSEDYYEIEVMDSDINYYFIYGPDIKRVLHTYTSLTGRINMPPMWALGYQQCRWGYYPEEKVMEIANTFRQKDIPCDVIYLDIDYMDQYRVFTWNPNHFPNPERMLEQLREKGFKVVTIVDPGVKKDAEYDVYVEGIKNSLFCKQVTGEVYHGKVWPGDAAFPDFTKKETRTWWGGKHKELIGKGIAGIWNDMNEPSDFTNNSREPMENTIPGDVILENDGHPRTFGKYHNSYGLNMCRATYEGFQKLKPEERPFIVTRSAYAGIQRYSSLWTGDNHSWWEHIAASMPMHMNIGMSGVPFVGGDVGGFQENASGELFARWMQLGVFTPFFRAHSMLATKPHEPWAFGQAIEEICRKYIKLRYSLMPYSYSEFYKASCTGLPVMRPLVLEYPEDENMHNLSDQFLYGENIMVAPVYRPDTYKRCVYLPEGNWYSYWSEEVYSGKRHILADAPIDIIPIFVKEGSIIPSIIPMSYVGEHDSEALILDVFVGKDGTYSLYEDDGVSNMYKEGKYSITDFKLCNENGSMVFYIKPVKRDYLSKRIRYILRIHGLNPKPQTVTSSELISCDIKEDVLTLKLNDTNTEQVISF